MTHQADRASIIVAYWHEYVTRCVNGDANDSDRWVWAWEAVDELVRNDPAKTLPLLVDLADACASAQALAYLGAGPVEDMVEKADDALFARILKAARKSARFRRALATIWIHDKQRIRELSRFFRECAPTLPEGVVDDAKGP